MWRIQGRMNNLGYGPWISLDSAHVPMIPSLRQDAAIRTHPLQKPGFLSDNRKTLLSFLRPPPPPALLQRSVERFSSTVAWKNSGVPPSAATGGQRILKCLLSLKGVASVCLDSSLLSNG